jgi:hypothetical protein
MLFSPNLKLFFWTTYGCVFQDQNCFHGHIIEELVTHVLPAAGDVGDRPSRPPNSNLPIFTTTFGEI